MQENTTKETSLSQILEEAFTYWWKTLGYQVLFSIIYFVILFGAVYSLAERFGFLAKYIELSEKMGTKIDFVEYQKGLQTIINDPNYMTFFWLVLLAVVFVQPLNLGLMKMYRKMDMNEPPEIQDLFAGYSGVNFFIFIGFYLFWYSVYFLVGVYFPLMVIWVLITLFSVPLLFFMNKSIFQSVGYNITALKRYPLQILLCCMLAVVVKYFGIFTIVGAVFTFPFWNAIIYTLYKTIFREVK
ncbi:MAG: hypothetical protein Q4C75_00470 [Bergeyella zoohelcum]|nr:hypothetical protein [Bergeyella zoohelcum]